MMAEAKLTSDSILSTKPKLKALSKYSDLHKEWYFLGAELEVDTKDLNKIKNENSDDRMRMILMFGVWLEEGEDPNYRKLLKALINIGKGVVAESLRTEIGLTSSLDSLLKGTTQARLSECTLMPIDPTKEVESKPSVPKIGHTFMTSVSAASDSTVSHSQALRDEFTQVCASTQHSRSIHKSTSTAPSDSETSITINDSQMHDLPVNMVSIDTSSEPAAYKAMIHCHDKLVTALSADVITLSGVLIAKEFIPAEISNKMLLPNLTPLEKATIMVNAVTDKIKIAPKRFDELLETFSEHICTKDIVPSLSFHKKPAKVSEQEKGVLTSSNQQGGVCKGPVYTAWMNLDPDGKIDLKASLLTAAETIGEKFAHLYSMARDSFEQRGITPQMLSDTLMDLTEYKPGSSCQDIVPLLKENGTLTKAKSVRDTFHTLRPHMSFFNYEILKYLIERKGSKDDIAALTTFLNDLRKFCKRHVFEVPFTTYSNGNQEEKYKMKQRLHVKVTEHFKAAFLMKSTAEPLPVTGNELQGENVCSSKLGIKLEDAKNIQRKLANILGLNPSSLFLDVISEGSIILTFLLPTCVSLADLDNNPEIVQLSSCGIIILCGPPGKLKLIDLTQNGMIMRWSQPEYGCESLARYTVYYQKKEHEIMNGRHLNSVH